VDDAVDGVDHSNVFAHLEGKHGCLELNVAEALFAQSLKELDRELLGSARDFNTLLVAIEGQTL